MMKKAQEEIVGFVLIIILVAVVAVVFLGISLRQPVERQESQIVQSFLEASMKVSTDCYGSKERRFDIKDMVKECYEGDDCLDGRDSCDALEDKFKLILDKGFMPDEEGKIKGYFLEIYVGNSTNIIEIKEGEETKIKRGSSVPVYSSGENVLVDLEVFY